MLTQIFKLFKKDETLWNEPILTKSNKYEPIQKIEFDMTPIHKDWRNYYINTYVDVDIISSGVYDNKLTILYHKKNDQSKLCVEVNNHHYWV